MYILFFTYTVVADPCIIKSGKIIKNLRCRPVLCYRGKSKIRAKCSETTLTRESQFHISTPLGIEPGSLMTGSKRVDHWTSGTVYECSEIAGSRQGSPQAADFVGCEAGRRTCSERETGTGKLYEIK
jgi:hypothetical protein